MADQWILPTDHEGCEWDDCHHAYDGIPQTEAVVKAWCKAWSPWLIVGFSPTTAQTVEVVFRGPLADIELQLDIYKDGAWVNLFLARGSYFTPSTAFMSGVVEKVRLRVYWYLCREGWVRAWVSRIAILGETLEPVCTVGETKCEVYELYKCKEVEGEAQWVLIEEDSEECGYRPPSLVPVVLCELFAAVGTRLKDLAGDISEFWAIGQFLAPPFEYLGDLFHSGADLCYTTFAFISTALAALEEKLAPEALLALIEDNWPTLHLLITDPVDWFLVQLTLAFDLEPWHTQSLEFLAKWILEEYFPTLYQIWLDPEDWFAILLEERFPILYYLVTDPVGEVLYLIGQAFDLTPYEAQSPEFIVKTLFERYFPELYLLWRDPGLWVIDHGQPLIDAVLEALGDVVGVTWGWLLDQFEERFEDIQERLYSLAEHALRYFVEGVW